MAKEKIENALKNERNTTAMVKKFVDVLKTESSSEEIDNYLQAFHDCYSKYPYYADVKESILTKVEALGMDTDHVNEVL
jgi:hypothetical protein